MPRHVLLLTATLRPPPGIPRLALTDPARRLADYERALTHYLALLDGTFDAIVYAENSGHDLSRLRARVSTCAQRARVEFIDGSHLRYDPAHGRGYGEFLLVDHAMSHARHLACLDDTIVWKCTGRYLVRNLAELVRDYPPCDLYCHMRDYPLRLCELYLLAWNARAYRSLVRGMYDELRNDATPGVHTLEETQFRGLVDAARGRLRVVPRFAHVPLIVGSRSWNDRPYAAQPWSPKILARRLAHGLAPWWWI